MDLVPDALVNGRRVPARIEIALSGSNHGSRAAEGPAGPLKRHRQTSNMGPDAREDCEGTIKRPKLQTVHNSTSTCYDDPVPGRRSSAPQHDSKTAGQKTRQTQQGRTQTQQGRTQAQQGRTQAQQEVTLRRSNRNAHGCGRPQSHQTRPTQSTTPQTLAETKVEKYPRRGIANGDQEANRVSDDPSANTDFNRAFPSERSLGLSPPPAQMPVDSCNACGFCADHLARLVDRAWRWIPNDDSFEALFESTAGLSDVKSLLMLRLCLGSIRDYARETVTAGRQASRPVLATTLSENDEMEGTVSGSSSDDGGDCQNDDLSDVGENTGRKRRGELSGQRTQSLTETESEDEFSCDEESGETAAQKGQRRRWSTLEEMRLRSYKTEGKSDSWIATKLKRTDNAVWQRWHIMCKKKSTEAEA